MHYQIINGSITLGANEILRDINFEIKDKMKIAVVGRNGAGKTTLLRGVAGELDIFGENHDVPCVIKNGELKIGFLKQLAFSDDSITLEQEVKKAFSRFTEIRQRLDALLLRMETENEMDAAQEYSELLSYFKNIGGDCFDKEYETVVSSFGFTKADEGKRLSEFSGALICVSHDRYFLEQITDSLLVFDEDGVTYYPFGYADWRRQKEKKQEVNQNSLLTETVKKEKKKYTTPLKERQLKERRLIKIGEEIEKLENRLSQIAKDCEEFSSDYEKLSVLSAGNEECEEKILALLEEQEALERELEQ